MPKKSKTETPDCKLCGRHTTPNRRAEFRGERGKVIVCLPCHGKLFTDYKLQRKLPRIFGPGK